MYCSRQLVLAVIKDAMQRARFLELRSDIRFVWRMSLTDKEDGKSRLFLVKPTDEFFLKKRPFIFLAHESSAWMSKWYRSQEGAPFGSLSHANRTLLGWKVCDGFWWLSYKFHCCYRKTIVPNIIAETVPWGKVCKETELNGYSKWCGLSFTDRYFMVIVSADAFLNRNVHITGTIMANCTNGEGTRMENDRVFKRG